MSFSWIADYHLGDKVEIKSANEWLQATVLDIDVTADIVLAHQGDYHFHVKSSHLIRHHPDTVPTPQLNAEPPCVCPRLSVGHVPGCEWKIWKDQA